MTDWLKMSAQEMTQFWSLVLFRLKGKRKRSERNTGWGGEKSLEGSKGKCDKVSSRSPLETVWISFVPFYFSFFNKVTKRFKLYQIS